MVKTKEDLTGKKFGRWNVIKQVDDYVSKSGHRYAQWLCECSCEKHTTKIVRGDSLKNGKSISCGCIHNELLIETNKQRRKTNIYSDVLTDEHGEYYIGITLNTNQEFFIDADDLEKINQYCWSEVVDNKGYHSLVTNEPETRKTLKLVWIVYGKNADHADRNPLNNRKYNLRDANTSQQNANQKRQINNTSGVIGVYWSKTNDKWLAAIGVDNKFIYLGYFNKKKDAIIARLKAEKKYYGEFAPQRYLFNKYGI